jgi:putative SOS response-associated peptidase YedK
MCTNYAPVQRQLLRDVFLVEPPDDEWKPSIYRDYAAPIVLHDGDGGRDCVLAGFGMTPRAHIPKGVKDFSTMNARFETVTTRRSFSGPWRECQFCLIPAAAIYEPNYEAGPKSVRYRIWPTDEPAFAIAGLWRNLQDGAFSFTMLTINADQHPLMNRMHAPGKEKRSVVFVPPAQWDDWLICQNPEEARSFMTLYPAGKMQAAPAIA